MDKELILILVNSAIAVAGFVMVWFINRLTKAIDKLVSEDAAIHERITAHREDVLKNYVRSEHLEGIKKDVIGRVDRLEGSFKEALATHEHRERENLMQLLARYTTPR